MSREENSSILNPYIFIFNSLVLHCTEAPKSRAHPPGPFLLFVYRIPAQDCQARRFAAQGEKVEIAGKE